MAWSTFAEMEVRETARQLRRRREARQVSKRVRALRDLPVLTRDKICAYMSAHQLRLPCVIPKGLLED